MEQQDRVARRCSRSHRVNGSCAESGTKAGSELSSRGERLSMRVGAQRNRNTETVQPSRHTRLCITACIITTLKSDSSLSPWPFLLQYGQVLNVTISGPLTLDGLLRVHIKRARLHERCICIVYTYTIISKSKSNLFLNCNIELLTKLLEAQKFK